MLRSGCSAFSHRVAGCIVATAIIMLAPHSATNAALILGSSDARPEYPTAAEALFRTADLPNVGDPNVDSRGVRSNRIQSQTFQVNETISVDSIFIGYRWNSDLNWQTLPVTFRVIEVDDIGTTYNRLTVNELAGPVTAVVQQPNNVVHQGFYALRLDWTGGQELILTPRVGQQGYAIEFVGSSMTDSPIAILNRTDNPAANTRALEMNLNIPPGTTGVNSSQDFIVAITGTVVPEPASLAVLGIGLAVCFGGIRRRG